MSYYANYTFFSLCLHDLAPNFQVCFQGRYARNVPQSLRNHSFSVALTESDSVEVPEWKGIC